MIKVLLKSAYAVWRQLMGPANVCIYPIPCPDYAQYLLKNKPLYVSIPLITIRLISCNPVTALIRHMYFQITSKK